MKALVYEKPGGYSVKDVPLPEPGEGEVRIKVLIAGICGTDIHLHNGTFIGAYPLIPGHEMAGIIDKIGPGVNVDPMDKALSVGQAVTMNGNYGCGECYYCKREQPLYCKNLTCLGVNKPGAFAEYMVVPKRLVYSTEGLSPEVAVFTEPLACTVHGMDVLKLKPSSDVLVFGAGSTGLLLTQLLIHGGAAQVTVADPNQFKLERAHIFGANHSFTVNKTDPESTIKGLKEINPEGWDVVVDATGVTSVQAMCQNFVRTGGTILFYGVGDQNDKVPVNAYDVFQRELTIKGSFAQVHSFGPAVDFLRSGKIQTKGLITHRFKLEDWDKALDAVMHDKACHKAVIIP